MKKRRRRKRRNPDPTTITAIVVGGLGVVALGSLVYALRGRRLQLDTPQTTPPRTAPPPPSQNIPPAVVPDPPPTPAPQRKALLLLPTNVPPEVRTSTVTGAEVAPGWMMLGWYTYQGEAPERMWIRVDENQAKMKVIWHRSYTGKGFFMELEGEYRWTVFMGDYPMATGTYFFAYSPYVNANNAIRPITDTFVAANPMNAEDQQKAWQMLIAARDLAGRYMSNMAARWIDTAYGG